MRKILFLAVFLLSAIVVYPNRNLRDNTSRTVIGLSGTYTYGDGTHAGGGTLSVTQLYPWFHLGTSAGINSDGCFNANIYAGPKFGDNFYIAPSLVLGMRQVREYNEYENTQNGDLFRYSRPAPRLSLGGSLRIGYNFGFIGIFAGVGYERTFSYSRGELLHNPWARVDGSDIRNIISAELGVACVLSDDYLVSGDNCLEISAGGGYSSMGGYVSLDVQSFKRFAWAVGHSYGGFTNFYFQSGNAEIGGRYNLEFYPWGSNSFYGAAIGIEAAMGQYRRSWSGVAEERPNRFETNWNVYSFGGRGSLVLTPLMFQVGILNVSVFGNVGVAGQVAVKGLGDFGYDASTSGKAELYWACGAKMSFAL